MNSEAILANSSAISSEDKLDNLTLVLGLVGLVVSVTLFMMGVIDASSVRSTLTI